MALSLWLLYTSYIGVQGRITEIVKWILFLLKTTENMVVLYTECIDCIVCLIMLSRFCKCKYLYETIKKKTWLTGHAKGGEEIGDADIFPIHVLKFNQFFLVNCGRRTTPIARLCDIGESLWHYLWSLWVLFIHYIVPATFVWGDSREFTNIRGGGSTGFYCIILGCLKARKVRYHGKLNRGWPACFLLKEKKRIAS